MSQSLLSCTSTISVSQRNVRIGNRRTSCQKTSVFYSPIRACSNKSDNAREDLSAGQSDSSQWMMEKPLTLASLSLLPLLADPELANAVDGAFGPLEGRVAALMHPAGMGAFLALTLYAGYLGWQWRRVRTIGNEISTLKKQLPEAVEGAPPSPLAAEIAKLTEERQALVKGGFKDKHFNAGSILLGGGVTLSVAGSINTWMRTGKLFPGPHLWAGAGITILWALAAALVPAMQKGNESARSAHIALNTINVALFLWQVPTGLEIVGKVLSFNIPLF